MYNKLDLLEGIEPQIQRDADGKPQRVWVSAVWGWTCCVRPSPSCSATTSSSAPCACRRGWSRLRAFSSELGAVQRETHDEEGGSLLEVRLPRVELNRLISREGLRVDEFIEQHFAIKPRSAILPVVRSFL